METYLVIDIGNTLTKIAVFKQDELLHVEQHTEVDAGTIDKIFDKHIQLKVHIPQRRIFYMLM